MNIAERSLNILVARLAWGCDISAKKGWKYGEYRYTTGFNVQPEKFPFGLKAREGREKLVGSEYESLWSGILEREANEV